MNLQHKHTRTHHTLARTDTHTRDVQTQCEFQRGGGRNRCHIEAGRRPPLIVILSPSGKLSAHTHTHALTVGMALQSAAQNHSISVSSLMSVQHERQEDKGSIAAQIKNSLKTELLKVDLQNSDTQLQKRTWFKSQALPQVKKEPHISKNMRKLCQMQPGPGVTTFIGCRYACMKASWSHNVSV